MKIFRWNKHYLGWGMTAFIVIVASILVFIMLSNFAEIANAVGGFIGAVMPIIYGFIIAYLLSPVVTFFESRVFKKLFVNKDANDFQRQDAEYKQLKIYIKNKPRRILSITVTMLIFVGIITGSLIAIIPQLSATVVMLVENLPTYINNATEWVKETFSSFPDIEEEINNVITEAGSILKSFLTSSDLTKVGDYLGSLTSGIANVVGILMNIVFGIVVAIYCLYSKEVFSGQAKKVIYCLMSVPRANKLISSVRKIHRSFGNFITGTVIDSFVVAAITFVVSTIFQVPFALLVSIVMGLTNIIPYFGPFIGIVPCLFLIFMVDPFMCINFIIIVAVIQNLNGNVISPKILGESTGLTSFWVVFAILVGQGLFGFWGLIIGIPLFAVIYSAGKTVIKERLAEKGLPVGSEQYTDIYSIDVEMKEPKSLSVVTEHERIKREKKEALEREEQKKRMEDVKKVFNAIKKKITGKK